MLRDNGTSNLCSISYCRPSSSIFRTHATCEVACVISLYLKDNGGKEMIPSYLVDFDLKALPVVKTDVIVIGAGIAGLFTALKLSEQHHVVLVTKKSLLDSNARYAQGGIAAVIAETDSPQLHL